MSQASYLRKKYWLLKDTLSSLYFDHLYGTETKKLDTALIGPDVSPYEPTDWFSLHYILEKIELRPNAAFIDIGTGKGRPLFMAARYPFSRIVGIEKSDKLAATARKNVESFLTKREFTGKNIEVWAADATTVDFPKNLQIISTFNPFRGAIFSAFLKNLERNLRTVKSPVFFIYQNALCHDQIVALPYAKEIDIVPEKYRETFKVYVFDPL